MFFSPSTRNLHGGIERRQCLEHARIYGFLKAMHQIPENLFKKVSFCVDKVSFLTFIDVHLRIVSENFFRKSNTGKLIEDLETCMELNKVLRTRQDLTLRLKYVPEDTKMVGKAEATKLAIEAAEYATQSARELKKPRDNSN